MSVSDLDDSNFAESVLRSGVKALVDFWAPTCGPCAGISRQIEAFAAKQNPEKGMKFFRVNVENAIETASQYNVRGLPTLLLFKDGQAIATQTGALSASKLDSLLKTWTES